MDVVSSLLPPPDLLPLAQQLRLIVERLRRNVRDRRTLDDLPRRHESVLSWLDRKGPLTTADLARWEQIRPQSMGTTVTEMVAGGLVVKASDPTDGRRELVALTDPGRRALRAVAELRDRDLADLLTQRLTDDERAVVTASLGLLERITRENQ
jgi:DNA-binding MarR family transcriptional regulator